MRKHLERNDLALLEEEIFEGRKDQDTRSGSASTSGTTETVDVLLSVGRESDLEDGAVEESQQTTRAGWESYVTPGKSMPRAVTSLEKRTAEVDDLNASAAAFRCDLGIL